MAICKHAGASYQRHYCKRVDIEFPYDFSVFPQRAGSILFKTMRNLPDPTPGQVVVGGEEAAPRLVKAVVTNEEFECKGQGPTRGAPMTMALPIASSLSQPMVSHAMTRSAQT